MTLQTSQVILLLAIAAFAVYATRVRSVLADRLIYIALVAVGVPLVLFPDWSTRVANLIGIGRGADLLFYLFIVLCLFYFASTASQLRRVEREITTLVRTLAIDRAADGASRGGASGQQHRPSVYNQAGPPGGERLASDVAGGEVTDPGVTGRDTT